MIENMYLMWLKDCHSPFEASIGIMIRNIEIIAH